MLNSIYSLITSNMKLNHWGTVFIQMINLNDLTLPMEHEPIEEKSLNVTIPMILLKGFGWNSSPIHLQSAFK